MSFHSQVCPTFIAVHNKLWNTIKNLICHPLEFQVTVNRRHETRLQRSWQEEIAMFLRTIPGASEQTLCGAAASWLS